MSLLVSLSRFHWFGHSEGQKHAFWALVKFYQDEKDRQWLINDPRFLRRNYKFTGNRILLARTHPSSSLQVENRISWNIIRKPFIYDPWKKPQGYKLNGPSLPTKPNSLKYFHVSSVDIDYVACARLFIQSCRCHQLNCDTSRSSPKGCVSMANLISTFN